MAKSSEKHLTEPHSDDEGRPALCGPARASNTRQEQQLPLPLLLLPLPLLLLPLPLLLLPLLLQILLPLLSPSPPPS